MRVLVCAPAVPEEADGQDARVEDQRRESHLGLVHAIIALGELDHHPVVDNGN